MEIEHVAMNVAEPLAMARWYVRHLGMRIVRGMSEPPYTHFLADAPGHVMLEIYHNPAAAVWDYAATAPLKFHVAFQVADAGAQRDRLIAAGAVLVEEQPQPDGSHLVMLRDPWGMPLQLCRRVRPMP